MFVGVKFRPCGLLYYYAFPAFALNANDFVIVEAEGGEEIAQVVCTCEELPEASLEEPIQNILRQATVEDIECLNENKKLEKEAFAYCSSLIKSMEIEMKLIEVNVFFRHSKILFYFSAPNRVDFRELIKELVKVYRTRIELRQIGVRHETQMLGGLGNCGQVCCCHRFLRVFEPVTIKMAKEQNLFLNPEKISGTCGRLLCCLSYEQETFQKFNKKMPKIGKNILTTLGTMRVIRTNLFRDSLTVFTEERVEQEFTHAEWLEILIDNKE